MDFTIVADELQKIMKMMVVTARANALDATGRVLIEAKENNEVVFLANNTTTALVINTDKVEVSQPGVVSIAYSKIKSFVSSFSPWNGVSGVKEFRFAGTDKYLNVTLNNFYENGKTSKGKLKLTCFNPSMISRPNEFEEPDFILNSTIFRAASNKVLYAIDPNRDSIFGALQGMNMSFDKENIYFAGSNGVVLSEYKVNNVSEMNEGNITFQYEFIMGLRRLLVDDIQLFWQIKNGKVAVNFENITFYGRLLVGQEYPKYKEAFENYTDQIYIRKDVLLDSLSPFQEVLDPEDNFRLTFEIKDKIIKIYNEQADVEVEQDEIGGLDFSIDANGKLFIQTVDAIQDDFIFIKFSNEDGSLIFDAKTYEDQKALLNSLRKR